MTIDMSEDFDNDCRRMRVPDSEATRTAYAMGAIRVLTVIGQVLSQGLDAGPEALRLNQEVRDFLVAALGKVRA